VLTLEFSWSADPAVSLLRLVPLSAKDWMTALTRVSLRLNDVTELSKTFDHEVLCDWLI
jgi:hypothetical protein